MSDSRTDLALPRQGTRVSAPHNYGHSLRPRTERGATTKGSKHSTKELNMTTSTDSTGPIRRPEDWTRGREGAINAAAVLARGARIDYDDEARVNETRADLGQAAVMVGCVDWHSDEDWEAHVSDAVANVVHFCRRAGLDPETLLQSALRSADGDLEDGPEAPRDAVRFP
jgi:hypothetical protein